MNKTKKIAFAAVSFAMAGSMAISLAACDNGSGGGNGGNGTWSGTYTPGGANLTNGSYVGKDVTDNWAGGGMNASAAGAEYVRGNKPNLAADLTPSVDASDNLTYSSVTSIKTHIGYEKDETGITYKDTQIKALGGDTASSVTFAGKSYVSGNLKPAWAALSTKLGLSFEDDWVAKGGKKASETIKELKAANVPLSDYAFITASADTIVTEQAANQSFLNINDYLYYMPNYAAFLQANPIVRLSLTADTTNGAMYMLPYFDGNDDIEKYVLMRKDVVEVLLDSADVSAATGTFLSQATAKGVTGDKASADSFMGQTGGYYISVTDPNVLGGTPVWGSNKHAFTEDENKAETKHTIQIVVDYDAALKAAKDEATPLGKAIKDACGYKYESTSGNIVDLQNWAINASAGKVTGAQLITILREYIKVAYHRPNETAAFYTTLSDVFNSAYAAWDVDLYTALGRCAVSSSALLGNKSKGEAASYMLGSRTGYTNRTYDVASMAGELYGIRGLTSRYQNLFTYIDSKGNMKDARANEATWNALTKMNALAKEGLYYTGLNASDGYASIAGSVNEKNVQFYSSTDYSQTQTSKGGFIADGTVTKEGVESGYNYAPILTPVSFWDTNDDGQKDTVMRFTESWRGVKDGGFVVPVNYVKGNSEKLSAVLKFIDYFYSNDGQILMTYGPQSVAGNITAAQGATVNADYGTWYGTKVAKTLDQAKTEGIVATYDGTQYYVKPAYQSQYFAYNNELYTGRIYKNKQIPVLTDENLDVFYKKASQNFTNHARKFLGSCLNLGIKDQGFEYQCTSKCGLAGSDIVALAISNGTIRHTRQIIDKNNMWYTLAPTTLPFTSGQTGAMADDYKYVSGKGGEGLNFFYANSKCTGNLLTDMMYYGFDTSKQIEVVKALNLKIPANAAGVITLLNTYGLSTVDGYAQTAWGNAFRYYNNNIAAN